MWQTQTISGGTAGGGTRLITVPVTGVRPPTASSIVAANPGIRIARRPLITPGTTTTGNPTVFMTRTPQQGIQNPSPIVSTANPISTVVSQPQQQIVVTTLDSGTQPSAGTNPSSVNESQE